jgi:hypothetical protein
MTESSTKGKKRRKKAAESKPKKVIITNVIPQIRVIVYKDEKGKEQSIRFTSSIEVVLTKRLEIALAALLRKGKINVKEIQND